MESYVKSSLPPDMLLPPENYIVLGAKKGSQGSILHSLDTYRAVSDIIIKGNIQALILKFSVPLMCTRFLLVIPKPINNLANVY